MCVENACNFFVMFVNGRQEKFFKKIFIPLFSTFLCGFAIYIVFAKINVTKEFRNIKRGLFFFYTLL